MFSVSTSVVLLVFFVSQALGQSSLTVTPNVTLSPSQTVVTSGITSSTTTPTKPTTKMSKQPAATPSRKTPSGITSSTTTPNEPTTKMSKQPTTTPSKTTLGQSSLTVTPSPSQTVGPCGIYSSLTTPTKLFTKPSRKTCFIDITVLDISWNDDYKNRKSKKFRDLSDAFSCALKKLYSRWAKDVEVSEVHFTEIEGKVLASAKVCLVLKYGVPWFIEEVFKKEVETGKLATDLPVIKDSAEFKPLGVSFKDWKAKEGECEEKCEEAAGPFSIVKECEPDAGFSCDGLKEPTEETDDCAKYCSSTVAVSVSFVMLVIGIFLSSSFQ